MKLSTIINQFNKDEKLSSITIDVMQRYSVCSIFRKGNKEPILKIYRSINVDIGIPEISNSNVAHLGIKRYRHLVTKKYYINLYNH
jgi:hypothetical protein